jgi:hypothetical protein
MPKLQEHHQSADMLGGGGHQKPALVRNCPPEKSKGRSEADEAPVVI